MQNDGIIVNYEILSDDEYIKELHLKLIEEAKEVSESNDKEALENEIGDVLEVIEHIISSHSLDIEEIQKRKKQKQETLGGFDQKIKTKHVEISEDNEALEYYLSNSHKYPEIK